jgi:putative ABC transport system permease protein
MRALRKIMSVFSFAAILISMLGLVAMSIYFIQLRSREIAVRKVFGSTGVQSVARLIRRSSRM